MRKTYQNLTSLLLTLSLSATLASCVAEQEEATATRRSDASFTLNITTNEVGATRGTTDISDGTAANGKTTDEKTVNTIAATVFKSDNSRRAGTYKVFDSAQPSASSYTVNSAFDDAADGFQQNDPVLVAINVPAGTADATIKAYAEATSVTAFTETNTLNIDQALAAKDGSSVAADYLPMFGQSTVTAEGTNFTATVTMRHLVAKVTLNSLTADFTGTSHTGASFTPTQVFLINVPGVLDMKFNADNSYAFNAQSLDALYQGEADSWTSHASSALRQFKDYLGTPALAAEKLTAATPYSKKYVLYTMPNRNPQTDANTKKSTETNTRLVIKGTYKPDDSGSGEHTAYYAVNLGTGDDYSVLPNSHYVVNAVIKGDGADDAYSAIASSQDIQATVTALDWDTNKVTAIVGNQGIDYSSQRAAKVGDLLFSDGSWGSFEENPTGEPVAIVFSTLTSDKDQAKGYYNGYAMALKRYDTGNANKTTAGWCADVNSLRSTLVTRTTPETFFSPVTALMDDLDGLTYCETAEKYCTDNSIDKSNLTAIAAARNYQNQVAAPTGTSGWYLPSIGQQYLWLKNLANAGSDPEGSTVYTGSEEWTNNTTYWTRSSASDAAAKAINDYVNAKLSSDGNKALYEAFAQGHYLWSSTERFATHPFYLYFSADGNLYLNGGDDKSGTSIQVRAVLAF